jgi:fluoride exporter
MAIVPAGSLFIRCGLCSIKRSRGMVAGYGRVGLGKGKTIMNDLTLAILVGVGGSLGALMRYGVGHLVAAKQKPGFYGTLIVNLAGSCAMGLFIGLHLEQEHLAAYAFAVVGILGGLTTYSTLNVQKAMMTRRDSRSTLAIYLGATYVGGFGLTAIGAGLGYLLHT